MNIKKKLFVNLLGIVVFSIVIISCKKLTTPGSSITCGNGICDIGESNITCPGDCPGVNAPNFSTFVNGSGFNAVASGVYLNSPGNYMVITATDDRTSAYDVIKIGLHSFTGVSTYPLNEANYSLGTNSWAYYTDGNSSSAYYIYCTNTYNPYIGTCSITKFDTINKKVSGTFSFIGKYSYWQQASCAACDSNAVYTLSGSFTDVSY